MKATQEEFDKLKQLDRIEYRQREEKIKNNFKLSVGGIFLKCLMILTIVSLLLLPQLIMLFGRDIALETLSIIFTGIGFFLVLTITGFLIDIYLTIKEHQLLKELHEEYFKTEVRK